MCDIVATWMIAMRMIWSPFTLPMSVAPRGFGVWQPPTVPIMYCFFNHPFYYIKQYQTILHNQYTTHSVLHFKEEKLEEQNYKKV